MCASSTPSGSGRPGPRPSLVAAGVARVEVRDAGNDDRLATVALAKAAR